MHRVLVASLLLACGGVWAAPPGPGDWQALRGKNLALGVSGDRIDQTLDACRKRGLSAQEADRLLTATYAAKTENLPADCIHARIGEGLAKQISVPQISEAAQARLDYLRQARELVSLLRKGSPEGGRGGGPPHLVEHVGLALESGLPPEVIQAVFTRKGPLRLGRLAHVVEIGEALHLAGFQPQQVQRIMTDLLDRNANRPEMVRVVGVLKAGLSDGKDFETLYASLWVRSN